MRAWPLNLASAATDVHSVIAYSLTLALGDTCACGTQVINSLLYWLLSTVYTEMERGVQINAWETEPFLLRRPYDTRTLGDFNRRDWGCVRGCGGWVRLVLPPVSAPIPLLPFVCPSRLRTQGR